MDNCLVVACTMAALFTGCASSAKIAGSREGALVLAGFAPRRGVHCESAAMLNALTYLGYGLSESDIVGGGGAPSFFYSGGNFPFIGGRSDKMREPFLDAAGIPYDVIVPSGDGWKDIVALLDRGLPVLLRVDMRWLPYLFGGKHGPAYMSFGGHWICLYGIDFDSREALVTDTAQAGPRRVKLADLEKARGSSTKTFPPRREYAWIGPKPTGWRFDADKVARSALDKVLANYETAIRNEEAKRADGPLVGLSGLAAFPERLAVLHTRVSPYALAPAYSYMADSIERNGTGGSAFRSLFRDFLEARAADCVDPSMRSACSSLIAPTEEAMAAWSALADSFDAAAVSIGAAGSPAAKGARIAAAEAESSELARRLLGRETALRDAIASALDGR